MLNDQCWTFGHIATPNLNSPDSITATICFSPPPLPYNGGVGMFRAHVVSLVICSGCGLHGLRLWLNNNHRCVGKPASACWTAGVTQPFERRRGCVCFSADVIKCGVGCKKPICMLWAIFIAAPLVKSAELMRQFWLRDANRDCKAREENDRLWVLTASYLTVWFGSFSFSFVYRFILLNTPAVVFPQTLPLQWPLPLLWRSRRALAQQVQWWQPAAPQEGQVEH